MIAGFQRAETTRPEQCLTARRYAIAGTRPVGNAAPWSAVRVITTAPSPPPTLIACGAGDNDANGFANTPARSLCFLLESWNLVIKRNTRSACQRLRVVDDRISKC